MAAEDFHNLPDQGQPSDLDSGSPYSGNRPASGARRATPGEVLSQGFQGHQNAGDFLGLDTEFAGSQDGLDLVAPPSTLGDTDQGMGNDPAPLPAGDPVQEFAEAPSAFEFGEDLGSEEGEVGAFDGEAPPSKKPLLVGALVAVVLGAGAMLYGPELYKRFAGGNTPVVKTPVATGGATDAGTAKAPKAGGPGPAKDAVTGAPTAATTEPGKTEPGKTAQPDDTAPVKTARNTPAGTRSTPRASTDPDASTSTPSATTQPGDTTPVGDVLNDLLTGTPTTPSSFPNLSGPEYTWASEDRLELIWRGNEVPLEAVKADAKTLMPRVGEVRVFTTSGDVFEGRLYAVGQNRVWIDAAPGRIGLDGALVAQIQVLPPAPAGQKLSGKDPAQAGGKRVRVRVPGGMLYGRVLKVEGEEVTLALEDGSGKVRVKASEVEDLGSRRAVVVSR